MLYGILLPEESLFIVISGVESLEIVKVYNAGGAGAGLCQ